MDPDVPADAQRIVTAYLTLIEAHASEDVYPGALRDLPYSKPMIQAAFRTSVRALSSGGQLTTELQEYLEVAYVSLADYVEDESVALLREYARAGEELAADRRLARDKTGTDAWRRVTEQSRLAGQLALAISADADRLRAEFRSWLSSPRRDPSSMVNGGASANARQPLV